MPTLTLGLAQDPLTLFSPLTVGEQRDHVANSWYRRNRTDRSWYEHGR
jgi:hypothetical protein